MAQYRVHLHWDAERNEDSYTWTLDNGVQMHALQPGEERQKADFMDPEEAFAASIASCHLLSFVTEAARDGFVVQRYEDHPVAVLAKNQQGALFVGKVLLTPRAAFGGLRQPTDTQVLALHDKARLKCIISNSVLTEISLDPQFDSAVS